MQIVEKQISELIPYEKNPRRNDEAVNYVEKSIREFGFKVPCIIDSNNVIVCGHTRYKAAQKIGMETVPCIIADDLTEEQIKAFRLADNKVSEMSAWDFDLLDFELQDIEIDMTQFGFDDVFQQEENEIQQDEIPETPEQPKSKCIRLQNIMEMMITKAN